MSSVFVESSPAPFLIKHIGDIAALNTGAQVLDLACGRGRNGLYIADKVPGSLVTLADKSVNALETVEQSASAKGLVVETWQADFEQPNISPLAGKSFDVIVIFRYLHRALMPAIREALKPGGILIYETYTLDQVKYGKPSNPDFLLKPGELKEWFKNWQIIEYNELIEDDCRAIAQLVCSKPTTNHSSPVSNI